MFTLVLTTITWTTFLIILIFSIRATVMIFKTFFEITISLNLTHMIIFYIPRVYFWIGIWTTLNRIRSIRIILAISFPVIHITITFSWIPSNAAIIRIRFNVIRHTHIILWSPIFLTSWKLFLFTRHFLIHLIFINHNLIFIKRIIIISASSLLIVYIWLLIAFLIIHFMLAIALELL